MKKLFLLLLLTIALFSSNVSHAFAGEASLGIYPPIVEIKAKEHANVSAPITLVNESETVQEFTISTRGFDIADSNKNTPNFYPTQNTPKNLVTFLKSVEITDGENSIKDIILYPKESKNLFITFPVTTSSQEEYYFSVIFSTVPEGKNTESTRVLSSLGAGILVFTSLNESENLTPEIKTFTTDFFHSASPVRFNLEAFNTGNSFKNVSGSIHIYNMFGNETGSLKLISRIITANTTRSLKNTSGELIWNDSFPLGLYTAKAIISYENAPPVTKEVRFLVLPVLPFIAIVAFFIILLGILLRVIKKIQLKE